MTSVRLRRYLECEALLHNSFDKLGFCAKTVRNFKCPGKCCRDGVIEGYHCNACCVELSAERLLIYGEGKIPNLYYCRYNSVNGCILETHKQPICIAWACHKLVGELKQLGINYNPNNVESTLLHLLTTDLNDEEFNEIKHEFEELSDKVNKHFANENED